jgi:hypothetical protein
MQPLVTEPEDTESTAVDEYYARIEHSLLDMLDAVRAEVTAADPAQALREFVRAHVRWRLERPEVADMLDVAFGARTRLPELPEEHRARIRAIKRIYLDELRGVLNAGARSGTFDFADVRVTAFAIVALCGSAHTWYDPAGDLGIDDVAAMYADFAAGMVRAPMRVE